MLRLVQSAQAGAQICCWADPGQSAAARGFYLSHIYPSEKDRRHKTNGVQVRVIEYCLEGVVGAEPIYRLVTTILDPDQAPAEELAPE